jgi:hypothetical protein
VATDKGIALHKPEPAQFFFADTTEIQEEIIGRSLDL